jgi:Domain of Unknown Function with PDB structure (DUF3857)
MEHINLLHTYPKLDRCARGIQFSGAIFAPPLEGTPDSKGESSTRETNMAKRRMLCLLGMIPLLIAATSVKLRAKEKEVTIDWQPITAADLALKDNPAQPGASAMILYREIKTDDKAGYEIHYFRIKILKEEGKKYADIAFPFVKGSSQPEFEARTIQPDGKIIDFDGDGFLKVVAKHKGIEVLAKTYTLPYVQVGNIIDY